MAPHVVLKRKTSAGEYSTDIAQTYISLPFRFCAVSIYYTMYERMYMQNLFISIPRTCQ
jgi:hypothetical protein